MKCKYIKLTPNLDFNTSKLPQPMHFWFENMIEMLNMVYFKTHGSFKKYVLVPKIWSNHCIFSDNIKHILPGRDFSFLCQGNWWLESPQSCNTIGTIISIRYIWNLQRPKWLINCGLDCMIFCKIDSERLL